MSTRKRKHKVPADPYGDKARRTFGPVRYGDMHRQPARRMICSHCRRTHAWDYARVYTVCASCGVGRWQ